ncbi:hypothetical protein TARUN_3531 [Trichoderma arundinaceum]|uniref:Uncharacterized protein n=1 Tax=Trichoderma arundinaceum TaxID=490622 RepID=A0A395NRW7_TRIAR|nr:hypothetical protein TARUN_3531 [Trichoderma arundinaceum]
MSFFDRIGEGLAYAHQEAAKHITAENINRGAQEVWRNLDNAAQQENINRAAEGFRQNWDNAARGLAEAAENTPPHVEKAVADAGEAFRGVASQVTAENIALGAGIVQEHVNNAASHVGREIGHRVEEAASWARDEKNIQELKDGAQAVAEQAATIAQQNPAAVSVASVGFLMLAAPAVITTPIMAVAGMLGFTSGGIAASSIAAGAQAGMGNVVAGSAFATVQSAAAGGYGLGVLTGLVQAAGGTIAAVGSLGGGFMAWLRGQQQSSSVSE